MRHWLVGLGASVIILLIVWPTVDLSLGGDHYIHLARSFASGVVNVDDLSPRYRDYIEWEGHKYLPFGPFPAVLLAPFVTVLGASIPLVFYGYALSVANVLIFRRILDRIGVAGDRNVWLVLLYFGGTSYLSVTLAGISTFFAHVVTTTFLLLAILETLGKRRFVLVGLLLGLAAASRMTAAFALPFFVYCLLRPPIDTTGQTTHSTPNRFFSSIQLLGGLAMPMVALALYNYARFGDPSETGFGLALLYSQALESARSHGLFSLAHVPKNVYMMLLAAPRPVGGEDAAILAFPYLTPSPWGMGLFFTSPALLYVFRANLRDRLVQASSLAIGFTLIPILTYYGIGYVQFGYRYALDFMPFIMLIVARGFVEPVSARARALIAASVLINIWGAITLSIWI